MQSNPPDLQVLVKGLTKIHVDNVYCRAIMNPLADLFKKLYQIY